MSTTPGAPVEPGHFAPNEDLPSGESELKLASSHLSQTPHLWYLLCYLFTLPYDLLPFGSRMDAVNPSHNNPSESRTAPAQVSRCSTEAQHSKSCVWCRSDGLCFDGADASTGSYFVVLLLGESVWELCTPLSTTLQLKRGGWWPPHLKTSLH